MIVAAMCDSYLFDLLRGVHREGDEYRFALFTDDADLSFRTEKYVAQAGECEGRGYSRGGIVLKGFRVVKDGRTSIVTFDDPTWPKATIQSVGGLIYNASTPEKNAVAVVRFEEEVRSVNGDFVVRFPAATAGEGIIRVGAGED